MAALTKRPLVVSRASKRENRVEITGIAGSIKQRESGLLAINRIEQPVLALVLALPQHHEIVAHKVARQHKRRVQPRLPDIPLNLGLAVEVRQMRQPAVRGLRYMHQRREDQMRHPDRGGHVGHVLALRKFGLAAVVLPVVGDQEDRVGVLEDGF